MLLRPRLQLQKQGLSEVSLELHLLEKAHVLRDADEHHDLKVDLHEDEHLVQRSENVALGRNEDPLVPILALDVLFSAWLLLPIYDEEAEADDDDGDGAEDEIADEKAAGLLLEERSIEPQPVSCHHGQVLPIDHVVVILENEVIDLVHQGQYHKHHKVQWVNALITVFYDEDCGKQS